MPSSVPPTSDNSLSSNSTTSQKPKIHIKTKQEILSQHNNNVSELKKQVMQKPREVQKDKPKVSAPKVPVIKNPKPASERKQVTPKPKEETSDKPKIRLPKIPTIKITKPVSVQNIDKSKKDLLILKNFKEKQDQDKDKTKKKVSIRKRNFGKLSIPTILIIIGTIALSVVLGIQSNKKEQQKLWNQLKTFPIPKKAETAASTQYPELYALRQKNNIINDITKTLYQKFETENQKIASLLILYDVKSIESVSFLLDLLDKENENIIPFVVQALGRLGDIAVQDTIQKLHETKKLEQQKYLLTALALENKFNSTKENIPSSLTTMLNYAKGDNNDLSMLSLSLLTLYQPTEEMMNILWNQSQNSEENIAQTAQNTLQKFLQENKLIHYATKFSKLTLDTFTHTTDIDKRVDLLKLMSIFGVSSTEDDVTSIDFLIDEVHKSVQSENLKEKATAIYVLGKFKDDSMILPWINQNLDQDDENLTLQTTEALNELFNPLVPETVLNKKFSSKPHVQYALASILEKYQQYISTYEWNDRAIDFVLNMIEHIDVNECKIDNISAMTKTLECYTEPYLKTLILKESDILRDNDIIPLDELKKLELLSNVQSNDIKVLLNICNKALYSDYFIKNDSKEAQDIYKMLPLAQKVQWNRKKMTEKCPTGFIPNLLLHLENFKNFPNFIAKVRRIPNAKEDTRTLPSKRIWDCFSAEMQKTIQSYEDLSTMPLDVQYNILNAINNMLYSKDFYVEYYFESIMKKVVMPDSLDNDYIRIKFHRTLLKVAYPEDIQILDDQTNEIQPNESKTNESKTDESK